MSLRSGNRTLMRDINRHLVLNLIKNRGPLSRTDIAALSNLGQSTVTNIIRQVMDMGLVREVAVGTSTGGRPPIMLEIDPTGGYAVGLKLTRQSTTLAMTDLFGSVVQHAMIQTADSNQIESYVDDLAEAIERFIQEAAIPMDRLMGVGVGMPGFIDYRQGICRHSSLLDWDDVPLAKMLEQRLNIGVVLDNNVTTLTLYELLFGSAQGMNDFLVITVGEGVGLGIVVNGRLMRGSRGGAGEFGHIPIAVDGPSCPCGNRGCLESMIGDGALIAQAQAAGLHVKKPHDLLALAAAGDPTALAIYAEAGRWLGRGLATLINLFNPSHIIVSGEGADAVQVYEAVMREEMGRHVFNGMADQLDLFVEPLEDFSWAQGAASLVLDEFFSPPIY